MKVIIAGCGRLGAELAHRLFKQKHEVSVIDIDETAFNILPTDFQGHLCEGDALNRDILIRAGIETADALAVVTASDPTNMVVGHVAQSVFHVPTVIARNYGPNCRSLFEAFNLQVISATSWGAQRMEEMIYHTDTKTIFSAGNGEVEIYEIKVPASWDGRRISNLQTPEAIVISITRGGRASMPAVEFELKSGDILHISATFTGIATLRKILQKKEL